MCAFSGKCTHFKENACRNCKNTFSEIGLASSKGISSKDPMNVFSDGFQYFLFSLTGQTTQMTGSYVDLLVMFSFCLFFVFAVGFTDIITSVTRKLFNKLYQYIKEELSNSGIVCEEEQSRSVE